MLLEGQWFESMEEVMLKVAAFVAKRLAKSIAFNAYIIPIVLATTTIVLASGVVA